MRALSGSSARPAVSVSNIAAFKKSRRAAPAMRPLQPISLRVQLVGKMRATGPSGENVLPRRTKSQALLGFMCLSQGEMLLRSRVAGMIWDRVPEQQARESLRKALNEIERAGPWRIERRQETFRLDLGSCWIDAVEGPDRPDCLLEGLHGISTSFDHWLIGERNRFENHWQTKFEDALDDLMLKNAPPTERLGMARNLRNFIPAHDPAVRALMRAYTELGERALAIREYERFCALIKQRDGLLPSEETVALYNEIIRQESARARCGTAVAPIGPDRLAQPALTAGEPVGSSGVERDRHPSIAVLPFQNLSVEKRRDRLAEGLTDDLAEALSRVPGLFVVSRYSAASFKNHHRLPHEIGEALGVRYLISGNLRVAGRRLRLIVELTDLATGRALAVSPFDEQFSDLLEVQQRLAEAVVHAIAPHIRSAEVSRVRIKRPDDYNAYDLLLAAQQAMNHPSRKIFESARKLFERATALEPQWATPLAWMAYWHVMRVGQGWSPDPATETRLADLFAERAIECDPDEPMAFAVQGHVAAYLHKDFKAAFSCFEMAQRIKPSSARAWLWDASAHAWTGDGSRAVEKITRAMALSPYDPLACAYSVSACMSYIADGQYGRAIEFGLRCIGENRSYTSPYKLLIVALTLEERASEARNRIQQLLQLEPAFSVDGFRRRFPGSAWPIGDLCCAALARAGVPQSH
jgi:TolB-like protein/DNA-binding SARP family transcriptional activator